MSLRRGALLAVFLPLLAPSACSDDDHEENHEHQQPAECEAISDACHIVDTGQPGPIHDCHETAHNGTAEQCQAITASCIPLCDAAAADAGLDGGGDGGH